ncbi:MAG: hypothetical protein ETSY2_00295, partial [Candidatus Entotheonella gemina]
MLYRFDDYIVDASRYELRQGEHVITIEPKVFQVLLYLLEHRGRVVSKDELLDACWAETFVSPAALTQCLTRLRKAVVSRDESRPLIKTLHRQGYRFMAEVETVSNADEQDVSEAKPAERPGPAPLPHLTEMTAALNTASDTSGSDVQSALNSERRQLTVLRCDLAYYDRLIEHLDAEDMHVVLQAYHRACLAVIERFGGHVAVSREAEVAVFFGYPQAHEDDVQRAIRAGLQMVATLRGHVALPTQVPETDFALRVGIHTGLVIVETGEGKGAQLPLVVGETPTIAASVRDLAPPDTVAISQATAALSAGYFECRLVRSQTHTEHREPLAVYEVRGENAIRTRLEVEGVRGLTPFVGREAELALLAERWEEVQDGRGQVVIVRGDAGIGKSRLVRMLKEQVTIQPHMWLECRCSAYHQNTAFYPVCELLRQLLGAPSEYAVDDTLSTIEALLQRYRLPVDEAVPLLAGLLALRVPEDRYAPLMMTPQQQRQQTLEGLLTLLLLRAAEHPVYFVVEDLQWADPSTLEFLDLFMIQVPAAAILAVLTCRPSFEPPWGQRASVVSLVLNRLTRPQMARMIVQVSRGKALPPEVTEQLMEKTDGVPLFVEESTRMLLESDQLVERDGVYEMAATLTQFEIPATLHDSLMARLDRLGTAKEIAQWCAALGRECTHEVLASITPFDEATLQQGLRQLVDADLVFQHGFLPQARYRFKHMLVRDAAYESILKRRRQGIHQQIAEVLEAQFPDTAEAEPGLVAHHYAEAGRHEQAIIYWQRAGQLAYQRSANQEAIGYLTTGLELLLSQPENAKRARQELDIQMALGAALMAAKGPAAPEIEHAYTRARELCRQIGEPPQLFPVLRGLWNCYLQQGALQTTHELAEQLLDLAQ